MANEAQRVLEILLKLKADTTGGAQIRAEINALQQDQAKLAAQLAAPNASVVQSQRDQVTAQALINAQMERRVIMETQLEAAEARIAGNPAMAARLEREASIRAQALTIQRTLNVTTEESIALAERMVIAQEASVVATNAMGINMSKAKAEALVLGRELATGNVRASTLGSLLGSLGTTLTVAGIGAYELYHFISGQIDQTRELTKEYEKIVDELNQASVEWDKIANRAEVFGDKVKIADKIKQELDKMSKEMDDFRKKELPLWQQWWDDFVTHNDNAFNANGPLGVPNRGPSAAPFASARDKKVSDEENRELDKSNDALDRAQKATEAWAAAQADVGQGLADYSAKLSEAEGKLAELNDARHNTALSPAHRKAATDAFADQLDEVNDLRSKVDQLGDAWDQMGEKAATAAKRAQQQEINASLREQATLLEKIRQDQERISQNPFLSADQKQALMLASMTAEMAALGGAIEKTKQQLANSALDPVTHERLQAQLEKDKSEFESLHQRIAAINAPFATELIAWVNQLGTAAHQAAGLITGTLQTAIDGISQSITGLILGTQDWKQAWNSAVTSIIGGIVKVVVQFIAGQIAMFVIRQVLGNQEQSVTSKAAAQSAAQWAPAAISASIASYGAASGFGVAAYIAALGLGEAAAAGLSGAGAAAGGGFKKGGFTGHGSDDEFAGPAHRNEFYFNARATKNLGVDNLYALMHAAEHAPHFGTGGRLDPNDVVDAGLSNMFWSSDFPVSAGQVVPDAGLYGTRVTLPFDPSAPDAPVTGGPIVVSVEPTVQVHWPGTGGAPYWNQPSPGGYNLTPNYIGQFGGNLGLGSNLLASLILLGYGTGRYGSQPVAPGGIDLGNSSGLDANGNPIDILLPGSSYNSGIDFSGASPVSPTAFIPGPVRIDPGFLDPATGMSLATTGTVIGRDTITGAPVVRSPSGQTYVLSGNSTVPYGDINTRFGPDSGAFSADQFTKNYLLSGGDPGQPNRPTVGDAGRDIFRSGRGHIDPVTGAIVPVSYTNQGFRDLRWVFPSQSESAALGLSFNDPAHVGAYNAWLMAHNAWAYLPHGANGMRLPGAPSRTDSILAWLAPGEHVVDAFTAHKYDRFFGGQHWTTDLVEKMSINAPIPRFADGGRVETDPWNSHAAAPGRKSNGDVHVYLFHDLEKALRKFQDSHHSRKYFKRMLADHAIYE